MIDDPDENHTHPTYLTQIHRESVLVKPVNTPITPLCSKLDPEHLHLLHVSDSIN